MVSNTNLNEQKVTPNNGHEANVVDTFNSYIESAIKVPWRKTTAAPANFIQQKSQAVNFNLLKLSFIDVFFCCVFFIARLLRFFQDFWGSSSSFLKDSIGLSRIIQILTRFVGLLSFLKDFLCRGTLLSFSSILWESQGPFKFSSIVFLLEGFFWDCGGRFEQERN